MTKEISIKINGLFSTDQDYHAEQQSDGVYLKKAGRVICSKIQHMLDNDGSLAVYQRNINDKIKWICYDFDIIKSQLEGNNRHLAELELKSAVTKFCNFLDKKEISYLIEYSGNRGIHIWITFQNETPFKTGYEITGLILEHAELNYNSDLIAIDLFPHSSKITNSVGSCVKLPLSKHKKSNAYSFFLDSVHDLNEIKKISTLDPVFISKQQAILDMHNSITLELIEKTFNVFLSQNNSYYYEERIKEVVVSNLNMESLLQHWESEPPLKKLKEGILNGTLNNQERKLLVGLLINVVGENSKNIGRAILTKIFEKQKNYDANITQKAMHSLSSFYFPSKEQIEDILKERFSTELNNISFLNCIFSNVISYDQGYFDFCITDVEIARNAEMKYLIQNDEAQSRKVFNELYSIKSNEYLVHVNKFIENFDQRNVKYYNHERKENEKVRNLISLECMERITTSMVLKQIHHFFDLPNSNSTHGYQVRKGFQDGYIFEPWLYLWIKFLSNISTAITNVEYSEYYIIKTDVTSFYDQIDHDKLKRILLESSPLDNIKSKLSTLDNKSLANYKKLISICLNIAKQTVASDKGLPQGPAYARFFAELYLADIDNKFDKLLNNDSIVLYQRYVDDIFIVCKNENEAKIQLEYLTQEVSHLGLELKRSKTLIKKVKDFSPDYDKYRSQSKYSVDRISSKYPTATDEEKSYAIDEFINLILSDSKQEDYSFIFSHLKGVQEVEPFKNNEIPGILESGVGRGSLYRNLFTHILENESLWHFLIEAKCFNSLQSEVLTSTIINFIEEGKSSHNKFIELMNNIIGKLTATKMVEEHLLHMNLLMGLVVDYEKLNANTIIDIISVFPSKLNIETTERLLDYINTELNSMHDKYKFINIMYAITHTNRISKVELTRLSSIFYSYLSLHMNKNEFTKKDELIKETLTYTVKYHYLVSLFSLSKTNSSHELLVSMWKYCACLFNNFNFHINEKIDYNWLHKIICLDMDPRKLYLLLSAIIDGDIFRGTLDNKSVFKTYHTLLLVLLSDKLPELEIDNIDALLNKIKCKSKFYEWIIDREHTEFLPSTREWFDNNIIYNNTIMLKRDNQVLIRKPHEFFTGKTVNTSSEDDYSELIETYNIRELDSLKNIVSNMNLEKFVEFLTNELSRCNANGYPNIFSNSRLLKVDSLEPFTVELYAPLYFICEERNKSVNVKNYSKDRFIELMFGKYAEATNQQSVEIYEKYISKLPADIDVGIFLKYLSRQFKEFHEIDDSNSSILIDLSVASALYCCLEEKYNAIDCFDKFADFYFPSDNTECDLHVFSVNSVQYISDSSPENLIKTIIDSIIITKSEANPFLILNIEDGIVDYLNALRKIISREESACNLNTGSFEKCQIKLNQIRQLAELGNGDKFNYSEVKIINVISGSIDNLSHANSHHINTASHKYQSKSQGILYLIALPSSLSKAFDYIESKRKKLTTLVTMTYIPYQINKVDITKLDRFEDAVSVIEAHNAIPYRAAYELLIQWLSTFPERFRDTFVLIIAAHQYMTLDEINGFCNVVLNSINNKENAMILKKVEDYNGTIRCFHTNNELSRKLERLDPNNIDTNRSEDICIIADVIISGSQVCKAMEFYLTETGENNCYFEPESKGAIKDKLLKMSKIKICCVLYTEDAIQKITSVLKSLMPKLDTIEVIYGREINGDAYFETTTKIGNTDKMRILELLSNEDECQVIYSYLSHPLIKSRDFRKCYMLSVDKINKMNLVSRYQSLPKKCFNFLYLGLKTNSKIHPMNRVLEQNDFQ